jgi:hypothetical protein
VTIPFKRIDMALAAVLHSLVINRIFTGSWPERFEIGIDGFLDFCLHPDVTFRRLHRRVTEKKVNLFEFTSSNMAGPSCPSTASIATSTRICAVV